MIPFCIGGSGRMSHLVEAHEDGALDVLALPNRLDHEVRRSQTLHVCWSHVTAVVASYVPTSRHQHVRHQR